MLDIDGISKRLGEAKHYAMCQILRGKCERCNAWFFNAPKLAMQVAAFVADIESLLSEFDELRTRHARLVDSTDTLVAALVDERFKKDHAAMLAELHELRTKDIEASKRMRAEIGAMPPNDRMAFNDARVIAKRDGTSILMALVNMVANTRHARDNERRYSLTITQTIAELRD